MGLLSTFMKYRQSFFPFSVTELLSALTIEAAFTIALKLEYLMPYKNRNRLLYLSSDWSGEISSKGTKFI